MKPSNDKMLMVAVTATCLAGIGLTTALVAQPTKEERASAPRGNGTPQPSAQMLAICKARKQGDTCNTTASGGKAIQGTCEAPQNLPLACVPSGGAGGGPGSDGRGAGEPGGGGPPMSQPNSGSKIAETQAYTSGVACGFSIDMPNPQIGLSAEAKWSCARGQRLLISNGIPDHPIGKFPNPANPNTPSAQVVRFAATTSPVALSGPGGPVKEPVMALNGIKFDPGTGGHCEDNVTDRRQCGLGPGSPGQWIVEALGQTSFDFGVDANHAHVQPGGAYHYHGVPDGMLSARAKQGEQMALIGWAADGFPVYARFGFPTPGIMTGKLKRMQPSYRLKKTPESGRPPVSLIPMGAFMQDWEYVQGLGDLDECNGRFGSTPEFPEGIYHYYATDAYPYIQRCVKGSIDSRPQVRENRPPSGESGRESGRRGPPGGQNGGQGRRGPGGGS